MDQKYVYTGGLIPDGVTHVKIGDQFNRPIYPYIIPSTVTKLVFGMIFNQPISPNVIPRSVTHLTFGFQFNHPLTPGIIPGSVTHLTFGTKFNQPLTPGVIPDSVTHLNFGYEFNRTLTPGVIPGSVREIRFGVLFNQPIFRDVIPGSVTRIEFGMYFDQVLSPGVIPGSVREIRFGDIYRHPIPTDIINSGVRILPENLLEKIEIRRVWNDFVGMSGDRDAKISRLRELYLMGYPIPVEPHDTSMLIGDGVDEDILRYYSIDRSQHEMCHQGFSQRLQGVLYQWIYNENYSDFNSFITSLNMDGGDIGYDDREFLGEYQTGREAYEDMREAIMTAPRSDHVIFAWRGMHGMGDLCMNAVRGTYIGFSRFMACSVAQEVSCSFARDGVMLLIELPENTPLLNLTCLKESEPEFILPDRTVFKVVNRVPYKVFCEDIECNEMVHIRLVGIYSKDRGSFEEYLDKESPEEIRIDMIY